jgi:hypothetical protein
MTLLFECFDCPDMRSCETNGDHTKKNFSLENLQRYDCCRSIAVNSEAFRTRTDTKRQERTQIVFNGVTRKKQKKKIALSVVCHSNLSVRNVTRWIGATPGLPNTVPGGERSEQ